MGMLTFPGSIDICNSQRRQLYTSWQNRKKNMFYVFAEDATFGTLQIYIKQHSCFSFRSREQQQKHEIPVIAFYHESCHFHYVRNKS